MIKSDSFVSKYESLLYLLEEEFSNLGISKKSVVAVGLSGGVDSSSTLAILKELGFNVIGITMKIWNPKYDYLFVDKSSKNHGCFGPEEVEDIRDIEKITKILDVPLYVIDLSKEYEETVLNYFKEEYLNGRTPNPCVLCNWKMKFSFLLEKAHQLNVKFDYFSTGHYVKRVLYKNYNTLQKANFKKKDQSYYLSFLREDQIRKSIFPLGYVESKDFVREIAKNYNLHIYSKPDSQNFISTNYIEIFKTHKIQDGTIVDKNGKVLSKHKGIHLYTIGQRKGLNVRSSKPLYVINIDSENNLIVVGSKEDLYQRKFIVSKVNWIVKELDGVKAKIRYTHPEADCKIYEYGETLEIEFKEKQMAITPGQIAVFYKEDILLGSSIIDKVIIEN